MFDHWSTELVFTEHKRTVNKIQFHPFEKDLLLSGSQDGTMKYFVSVLTCNGRRDGLVVCTLDSRSRGPGSSPGWVTVLCSWARYFTLTVPLSTQEYKWVPANCRGNLMKCWEVTCDGLTSHPGGVAILLVASCYRNWDMLQQ